MASTKKTIRLQVTERLENSFADLKNELGKSAFKRNIKKAARALSRGFKGPKKSAPKKQTGKKAAKKSAIPAGRPGENGTA